jgi:hypothetical protein
MKKKRGMWGIAFLVGLLSAGLSVAGQDLLRNLGRPQEYVSRRVSSYDRTGGNRDAIAIGPGETAVLAEIPGPGAIHHLWVTIAAEPFYGRKIILRLYWDGEKSPSVEAPIGDFFGVGHGLNRNFSSLPLNCSSEGRARNSYWYMPFLKSAKVTVTNEGSDPVAAFYYYVDYRILKDLAPDTPFFHAQYRQEMPYTPGQNYVLLEAEGRGHYAGCNLSVLQRAMGWWGEGDDMIYVDGEPSPSLHGTGSEDYFSDAWGMREDENLFYGCPLQEDDFQAGSKATVYRFHIPDPIPFTRSIRVTIEHGHANDRSDFYSSTAYWYQTEPHRPFPPLPSADKRLPFALEPPENFLLPKWEKTTAASGCVFEDKKNGLVFKSEKLSQFLTSYYGPDGSRYPALATEGARADGLKPGTQAELTFPVEIKERYNVDFYFLKSPLMGSVTAFAGGGDAQAGCATTDLYAAEPGMAKLTLSNVLLDEGTNTVVFRLTGKNEKSQAAEMAFIGMSLKPSSRHPLSEWSLIGPFEAPDMTYLSAVYPPEKETALDKRYPGKNGQAVGWKKASAGPAGLINLLDIFQPNEQAIAYGLAYVYSPDARTTHVLLGTDDGVRLWLNDRLVHENPAYRGAYPDTDKIKVTLRPGWNKVLIKVLQGAGGWGFYLRFTDPDGALRYAAEPQL